MRNLIDPTNSIHPVPANWTQFLPDAIYVRKALHEQLGGSGRGGISPSAKHPIVFIFTGESGHEHGYAYDGWQPSGMYHYTGEGQPQHGDMQFIRGNRAIRDQIANRTHILLFESLPKRGITAGKVRFICQMTCLGYALRDQDAAGNQRQVIVFELAPIKPDDFGIELPPYNIAEAAADLASQLTLAQLRSRATRQVSTNGSIRERIQLVRKRSRAIRAYVLARADGIFEVCGKQAPFRTASDKLYLEAHHINRLADGGPDDPQYVAAVCPNCHREAHHGAEAVSINASLLQTVAKKEAELHV